MPRRRRGAKASRLKRMRSAGWRCESCLHSPKDMVAGALAFAAVSAIITNALFLQAGHHPAPMFGSVTVMHAVTVPANPLPRPRPVEADATPSESKPAEPQRAVDPLANLVKATATAPVMPAAVPRPPAAIPLSSHNDSAGAGPRRVAAVQRALTEYGYGQLKPTGTAGSDTQAAILKFERTRRLPVTGQVSDRLVRELTAMIGHPIE